MKVQSICAGLMVVAGLISVSASADQDRVSAPSVMIIYLISRD
jgi:hypothetical protein